MLIEHIIEFELRGACPPDRTCALRVVIFMTKNKNLKEKFSNGLLFTAKILLEAMYFTFPTWTKSLTKFNSKMQDFKRVLDLNCK